MPNTSPGGLPYPAATAPVSSGAADIQALAQAIDPRLGSFSQTPPANPVDGQIWRMVASVTDGIVWTFRYNAGSPSAYKWEFVGGAQWGAAIAQTQTIAAAGTWQNLGPSGLPIPRAGEYLLSAFCVAAVGGAAAASPYLAVYGNTPGNVLASVNQTGNATWALALAIVNARPVALSQGASIGLSGFGPAGTTFAAGGAWSLVPTRIL